MEDVLVPAPIPVPVRRAIFQRSRKGASVATLAEEFELSQRTVRHLVQRFDDGTAVLTRLAGVLGMPPKDVSDKVRLCDAMTPNPCWHGSPYQPIPITDSATTQQALQIMERREDFPGITAEPTAVRRYAAPNKSNAAQVLGYLGPVTDDEVSASEKTSTPLLRSDQIMNTSA